MSMQETLDEHTSMSSLGGGGGGVCGERFLAMAEGRGLTSGGSGGRTAMPTGRAPPSPEAQGSGVSPGVSALSSISVLFPIINEKIFRGYDLRGSFKKTMILSIFKKTCSISELFTTKHVPVPR